VLAYNEYTRNQNHQVPAEPRRVTNKQSPAVGICISVMAQLPGPWNE
jgi:hypothetical protein